MKLLTLILLLTCSAFPQDSTKVTDFTADTSPAAAGVFYYIESSTDKHITWGTLTTAMRDSLEANDYVITGAWTGLDNYVTIADAETITGKKIYSNSLHGVKHLFPTTTDTYFNGWSTVRWLMMMAKNMYAENFYVLDPGGSDSTDAVTISYDGTNVTFDKPLNITQSLTMDSAATVNVLNLEPHPYIVPSVGDTILTLTTSDLYSLIELDLPGDLDGISKFQIDTAAKGMVLKIYNADADYDAVFVDLVGNDDNLYMAGDFTLSAGLYQYIEFLCIDATKAAQKWMETSRSNN